MPAYDAGVSGDRSLIQREIRQTRPFRSRRQEAFLTLLRTADIMKRFITRVVEPVGITRQQYNVLRILRGAGDDGLPTLDIGERMVERSPGVTRLVDRLVDKGCVLRERCPDDRRQVICRITGDGLDLLAELDEPIDRATDDALAGLDDTELKELVRLLDRIRASHSAD